MTGGSFRIDRLTALLLSVAALIGVAAGLQLIIPVEINVQPDMTDARLATVSAPPRRVQFDSEDFVATILARPVFDRDRRPIAISEGRLDIAGDLRLEGTVVMAATRRALITDAAHADAGALWYEVGAEIEGWRIDAIDPGSVQLTRGSETAKLSVTGVTPAQSVVSSQQRAATPIYLVNQSRETAQQRARRRAALDAIYQSEPQDTDGQGKYE